MGKSYRRHHKRPKRKQSRKRRGAGAGDAPSSNLSSMIQSSSSLKKHLNDKFQEGLLEGKKHIESANKMAQDLKQKAKDSGKKAYQDFKYSSPTNFALAESGESAYSSTSKAMQPHYEKMKEKMKSSMASMGSSMKSSMGFSPLSKNKTDIEALKHAQNQGPIGTPMQNDPYNLRQTLSP